MCDGNRMDTCGGRLLSKIPATEEAVLSATTMASSQSKEEQQSHSSAVSDKAQDCSSCG